MLSANPFVLSAYRGAAFIRLGGRRVFGDWDPLTWISLMTDVTLFGVNPGMMHLHSMALHGLNALLLYALLVLLGHRATRDQDQGDPAAQPSWETLLLAFVSAGLWAVHPLRAEAVAWISERKEVLCVFFALLSYLMYFKSLSAQRGRVFLVASFGFAFLAIFRKAGGGQLCLSSSPFLMCSQYSGASGFSRNFLWFGARAGRCALTYGGAADAWRRLRAQPCRRVRNALAAIATYLWQIADVRHLRCSIPYRDVQRGQDVAGMVRAVRLSAQRDHLSVSRVYAALSKAP